MANTKVQAVVEALVEGIEDATGADVLSREDALEVLEKLQLELDEMISALQGDVDSADEEDDLPIGP